MPTIRINTPDGPVDLAAVEIEPGILALQYAVVVDGNSVNAEHPLPVEGALSLSGVVPVSDNGGSLTVDDGGSSVTIDGSISVSSSTGSPVFSSILGWDGSNNQKITTSVRGSANNKNALDVAQASALAYISISSGSGTRYWGATSTPGTANSISDGTATGTIDALGYSTYTVGLYDATTPTGSVTLEGSHTGTSWAPLLGEAYSPSGGISTTTGVYSGLTNNSTVSGPLVYRYIRVKTSGTQTGTMTLQFALTPMSLEKNTIIVSGTESTTIDTATPSSGLAVLGANYGYIGGVGGYWQRIRVPNISKTATATASGDTVLWTPTSGRKFRLMRYMIQVTADAATSGGGVLDIVLRDATTGLAASFSQYVPATAGTVFVNSASTGWVNLGNGYLSTTNDNVLNINLSAALTSGKVRVVCVGTEE